MEAIAAFFQKLLESFGPAAVIAYSHDKAARLSSWWKRGHQHWPLALEYRLRQNLLAAKEIFQVRLVLVNKSPTLPVKDVRVAIESLEIVSPVGERAETYLSGQFTKMPLHIERGQQGMELRADDSVEIWVAEHRVGENHITFRCSEKERPRCQTEVGEYRLVIAVSGQGIRTMRRSYRVAATRDTTLEFSPE